MLLCQSGNDMDWINYIENVNISTFFGTKYDLFEWKFLLFSDDIEMKYSITISQLFEFSIDLKWVSKSNIIKETSS